MVYIVGDKEMSPEEYSEYIKKENQKEFERVEAGILKDNPWLNIELHLITENEFNELLKKCYRATDLLSEFMMDCGVEKKKDNNEIYEEFKNKYGLMLNYSLSSTPAMDSWQYDVIFKHKHLYYLATRWDTN